MLLPLALTATLAAGSTPRADLDAGRYLKALAEAETSLRANPDDALALAVRSQALTSMMRLQEAQRDARRAADLAPSLGEALLARALAGAGIAIQERSFSSLKGVSNAMADLRAAVKADPGLMAAWTALGLGYEQLPGILGGSTRKALECAEALKGLDRARGFALQGTILAMEGRWNEARGAFGSAFATRADDPDTLYAYLDALGSRETRKVLGSPEQKRLQAQEARRLLPAARARARAVTAVCDAFLDADQGEEAWKAAQSALKDADAPSLLRLECGKIAARSGLHRAEGLACLDQVLREPLEGGSGGYAAALWRKGQILQALGRLPEARAAAEDALRRDPGHGGARRLLDDLRK